MAGGPMQLWNHWSTQILVLLSLSLQVLLLLFAGIRRREAHKVLRLLLWLMYQLADSTATYALGTLALSTSSREHRLMAFWAPFLLLHLGGPDNITAYALQDNELWLRHLQTLVVQVLGVVYVLYKHIPGNGPFLLLASILMFTVGFVKYGERTWALRCGNIGSIRSSVEEERPVEHNHCHPEDQWLDEEEKLLREAHSQFHICKRAIADSSISIDPDEPHNIVISEAHNHKEAEKLWVMMEMELSLLYDILYTKAAVIHQWFGYSVRVFSPLTILASLLLFQLGGRGGDRSSTLDIAVTYVLLAGALFLETTSLLNALASTWTYNFLYATRWIWLRYTFLCNGRWDWLRRVVMSLGRLVNATGIRSRYLTTSRRWPGSLGQCNMLRECTLWKRRSLIRRLANFLALNEWTVEIKITEELKSLMYTHIRTTITKKRGVSTLGLIRKTWGQTTIDGFNLKEQIDPDTYLGAELQEGIIIWHVATDILLARRRRGIGTGFSDRMDTIRAISDYMMFLLVKRPSMLPGLTQNKLYDWTYDSLTREWSAIVEPHVSKPGRITRTCVFIMELFSLLHDRPISNPRLQQREMLADALYKMPREMNIENTRVIYAVQLAEKLDGLDDPLLVLQSVWMDILLYTANRCSRESHAAKLNNGGEFTTILWLMTEHLNQQFLRKHWDPVVK